MDNDAFVADVISADATFETTTNAAFATQIATLASNMSTSDAAALTAWQTSYATVITNCISSLIDAVTNYYTNTIVVQKNAAVTNFGVQIRARNAVLVQQFALIRPPDDVTRITATLESIAVSSIAAYDTQQTGIINAKRDAVLAKVSDPTQENNLRDSFSAQFNIASQTAVAAFLTSLTLQNQIFHDVLAIADANFAATLLATLTAASPPLTLDEATAIVTTRDGDRDQIVTWRQQMLDGLYTQANAIRAIENTALIVTFNLFDIVTFMLEGKTIANFYAE